MCICMCVFMYVIIFMLDNTVTVTELWCTLSVLCDDMSIVHLVEVN